MMAQIFSAAKFPYNIMRTGCVARDQTQCPLSKTIPNAGHYSSELHRGHLGMTRTTSFMWKAANNFHSGPTNELNRCYMLNKLAHVADHF